MVGSAKPVIVLVRPQLGQNIGKAARAMLNFGLTEMRLVAPRDGWPNPDAGPSASGADIVLQSAQVFETVQGAIADCSTVYATTVRRRDLVMPVLTPEDMAEAMATSGRRTAILFGAERSGLETDATWSHPSVETRGHGYLLTKDSLRWYRDHYIGKEAKLQRDPCVSPLFASDFANAPRAIVAVAGFDPLVDEGVAYAKRLEEAGVTVDLLRYDSLIHGFLLMTGVSRAAMSATEEIARRIGEILTH